MSSPATPGTTAAEHERYVLFQLQCCMQEMNSGLKIIDVALNSITKNLETMRRRRHRHEKVESNYYADSKPGLTLSFN
jgi:hypothetical protein